MSDNIVIFGGGVPLKVGDTIIGGLGISGGTGEEDNSLAEYGLQVLKRSAVRYRKEKSIYL